MSQIDKVDYESPCFEFLRCGIDLATSAALNQGGRDRFRRSGIAALIYLHVSRREIKSLPVKKPVA
jgi:hypothetical protein